MRYSTKNFRPIPSLDNKFEINIAGELRNAKTKRLLKKESRKGYHANSYVVWFNGKKIHRTFYSLVAEAFPDETFLPIPSLDNKFEINEGGKVRHIKTKKAVPFFFKKSGVKTFIFRFKKNDQDFSTNRALDSLLWEVHGIKPKEIRKFKESVTVFLSKDNVKKIFPFHYCSR